ncbi:MAG: deoxyribose-phosphate aldolase [Saprospiraceae bacterium]|nr:deoxyribose-phosphate aldolase [Saprospiraceae bacterium]
MDLANFIEHTILKADCSLDEIKRICKEANQFNFPVVCVPPFFVKNAVELLMNEPTKVATVIGFPMGYSSTAAKVEEIKRAVDDGVSELDVVVNICAVKSGMWNFVRNDIDSVVTAAHLKGKTIKIILETGLLTDAEIQQLCEICLEVKPDFVKTSTGFNGEGATVMIVEKLKTLLQNQIKIKASGGIRTKEDASRLLEAGAVRIGSSSSVMMMHD